MNSFHLNTSIAVCDTIPSFVEYMGFEDTDVILTNAYIYEAIASFIKTNKKPAVIFQEKYGKGEPTDIMVDAIRKDLPANASRIIAIGGGTIIDIAKFLSLEAECTADLYTQDTHISRMQLMIVPTTCGTGSEVTDVAVCELTEKGTKKGLADRACCADQAVLVPDLLQSLPFQVFATSSIDALIHATESFLSPSATDFSRMCSQEALRMILGGYLKIGDDREAWKKDRKQYLEASTIAGIAFSNAGCATVHALAYPLGAVFHIPHGLSNALMFQSVMEYYASHDTGTGLREYQHLIGSLLSVPDRDAIMSLCNVMQRLLPLKPLKEYGMTVQQCHEFAVSVDQEQQRLLKNSYVKMSVQDYEALYRKCLGE